MILCSPAAVYWHLRNNSCHLPLFPERRGSTHKTICHNPDKQSTVNLHYTETPNPTLLVSAFNIVWLVILIKPNWSTWQPFGSGKKSKKKETEKRVIYILLDSSVNLTLWTTTAAVENYHTGQSSVTAYVEDSVYGDKYFGQF